MPDEGIYTQHDPIGLAGGNPTIYGFVWNSLWQTDPWGLAPGDINLYDLLNRINDGNQAHHLNQNAAYRNIIPRGEGISIKLHGNIFSPAGVGTPHFRAHRVMERFWNQYRPGGALAGTMPTNWQYSRALRDSMKAAGLNKKQVKISNI